VAGALGTLLGTDNDAFGAEAVSWSGGCACVKWFSPQAGHFVQNSHSHLVIIIRGISIKAKEERFAFFLSHISSICDMSRPFPSSLLQFLFDNALRTGLRKEERDSDYPFARQLEPCCSVDFIPTVLQEQAQGFLLVPLSVRVLVW
jgi:hypothetical protein